MYLYSELMPPLPKGGVFEIEEIISSKRHIATTVSYNDDVWLDYFLSCDFLFSFSGSGKTTSKSGDPMAKSRTESSRWTVDCHLSPPFHTQLKYIANYMAA